MRLSAAVVHAASLHAFELGPHASFLDLALPLFLGVFKVTSVTKVHQVSGLVDFTLETTKSRFDGFSITDNNLDIDVQFGRRTGCNVTKYKRRKRLV